MKKFRINRKYWLRGKGGSWLWSEQDQAGCYIGHIINQYSNIPFKDMIGKRCAPEVYQEPDSLNLTEKYEPLFGTSLTNSDWSVTAMKMNDEKDVSDSYREAQLRKIFANHDIELEFYN